MNDLSQTITPKSDQLNSDDLIAGPMTITVARVSVDVGGEQPVAIGFEGDGGKPYRPCKSMRRVLVALWGKDGNAYAGRSMTLYRDPKVTWGGMAVGGIRISHMSDIDETATLVLTETKKTRKPFTVKRIEKPAPKRAAERTMPILTASLTIAEIPVTEWAKECEAIILSMHDEDSLTEWWTGMEPMIAGPNTRAKVAAMVADKRAAFAAA